MNFQELHQYIVNHGTPSGPQIRSKEFHDFCLDVRRETSFLDELYPNCKISMKIRMEVISSGEPHPPKCSYCLENYVESVNEKRFSLYCCSDCREKAKKEKIDRFYEENPDKRKETIEKIKKTNLERYGVEFSLQHPTTRQKSKETSLARYGTEYPRQNKEVAKTLEDKFFDKYGVRNPSNLPEVQEKRKKTYIERFGVDNPSSNEKVKDKRRKTIKNRYGVDCVLKDPSIREKCKDTMIQLYGTEHPLQVPEFFEKVKSTNLERYGTEYCIIGEKRKETLGILSEEYGNLLTSPNQVMLSPYAVECLRDKSKLEKAYGEGSIMRLAESLGISYTTAVNALHAHGVPINKKPRSKAEKDLEGMIRGLGFDVVCNDRTTFGVEVDLYIPEAQLAIEYNGIYWHSSIFKESGFHQRKSLVVRDKGENLIHVWEDDWIDIKRREIVKEIIKTFLGVTDHVSSENSDIVDVSEHQARELFNKNSIHGFVDSTVYYGISCDGEIVFLVGLSGNGEIWKVDGVSHTKRVDGGLNRILDHFKSIHEWEKIEARANLNCGDEGMYRDAGFSFNKVIPPKMYFTDGRQKRFPKEDYEDDLMYDLFEDYNGQPVNAFLEGKGIHRVYCAGFIEYVMNK